MSRTIAIKNLHGEAFSLTPSALVTLFEIDIGDILFDKGVIDAIGAQNENQRIFRFHANVTLMSTDLYWQGKKFVAAPIRAEGFEMNSRGTLPTPRLAITVNEQGIPLLAQLKAQIETVGDLVTAKVTRIRTFAKYLDAVNFVGFVNPTADPLSEFPREVYYVDRKSNENKNILEFELASILDVEGVQLPNRVVVANRCIHAYRGCGCMYEYSANRVESIHGSATIDNQVYARMPVNAPPVANDKDESIQSLLPEGTIMINRGRWSKTSTYTTGDFVYIEKDGLKYYFVAKRLVTTGTAPPNQQYWIADQCSKLIRGCGLRWGLNSPGRNPQIGGNPFNNSLPMGAFPATNKIR